MSYENLDLFFKPKAVAVIGAGPQEGRIGHTVFRNMCESGFQGPVFPVNPKYGEVDGFRCYPDVEAIAEPVDLAVLATPLSQAVGIIEGCGAKGIHNAVIISAGGAESGLSGWMIEQEVRRAAEKAGVRVIGPNCFGVISTRWGVNASFARQMPLTGGVAFISQSGAIGAAILDWALSENIGFSHFVSVGGIIDVDFGDLIDYLGSDSTVRSILLYMESVTNARSFMSAARAAARVKPIIALKSGRSQAGALAAACHTGALAGEDAVFDAAFRRAGIVRVDTIEELFDCAELAAKQPRPRGWGLGIVTNAGGPGVMAADQLAALDQVPAVLGDETLARLDEFLPSFWSRQNPIDIIGDSDLARYVSTLEVCLDAPEIHALVVIFCPQALIDGALLAEALVKALKGRKFPVFGVWMGGPGVEEGRKILNEAGIPTYASPERAVKAFHYLRSYEVSQKILQQVPPKLSQNLVFDQTRVDRLINGALAQSRRHLTEIEAKEVFKAYGLPVTRTEAATSPEQAVRLAEGIGYPVVLKIDAARISHKSDVGGVRLNLENAEQVRTAYEEITTSVKERIPEADVHGVSVQPMIPRPEFELILGCRQDETFGPALLFGLGGFMTEIIKDKALALPPLDRHLARMMIEATKVSQVLSGYRNRPVVDLETLEEVLVRLSQLVIDFPQITEFDINPLVVHLGSPLVLDARMVVEPSSVPSPLHLAISPYPQQLESSAVTKGGVNIRIRPIRPEDAPQMKALYDSLSEQSIYLRFHYSKREFPPELAARYTQIDYDREIALVALEADNPEDKILGVVHTINLPDGQSAELAILVGDPWQGKGIGACLMKKCMDISLDRGLKRLHAYVLPENTVTRVMMKSLGWVTGKDNPEYFYFDIETAVAEP